jgi:hypothetical protein
MLQSVKVVMTQNTFCSAVDYSYSPEAMYVSITQIQIQIYNLTKTKYFMFNILFSSKIVSVMR